MWDQAWFIYFVKLNCNHFSCELLLDWSVFFFFFLYYVCIHQIKLRAPCESCQDQHILQLVWPQMCLILKCQFCWLSNLIKKQSGSTCFNIFFLPHLTTSLYLSHPFVSWPSFSLLELFLLLCENVWLKLEEIVSTVERNSDSTCNRQWQGCELQVKTDFKRTYKENCVSGINVSFYYFLFLNPFFSHSRRRHQISKKHRVTRPKWIWLLLGFICAWYLYIKV